MKCKINLKNNEFHSIGIVTNITLFYINGLRPAHEYTHHVTKVLQGVIIT